MTCPSCAHRTRDNFGPCAGCGSIAIPFLGGYFNAAPPEQFEPWQTVPWDPAANGEEVKGRTLRALRLTAKLAIEAGWSAATLEARPRWNEVSIQAALVRTAVRWGMIQ